MDLVKNSYVIAEAGVNHNGRLDLAMRLVDEAVAAGADAVKFQTFKAGSLVAKKAPKAQYQVQSTGAGESQLEMLKRLELSVEDHHVLVNHCRERGIQFLSTPFDFSSADFLIGELDLPRIKISSGDLTTAPLLHRIARSGKPVIISTGMSTLGEVEEALGVLAHGYLSGSEPPSLNAFQAAYCHPNARAVLQEKVSILQCTTEYPAPFQDVNLRAMDSLRSAFGLPVGLSDHTPGIAIPIAAVARGAEIIEKHFTLDQKMAGPDHQASLDPLQLRAMIAAIREVEQALGSSIKSVGPSEWGNRKVARRSLVASVPILKGEKFSEVNLTVKRPGSGISPVHYWDYLGKVAQNGYQSDEEIHD